MSWFILVTICSISASYDESAEADHEIQPGLSHKSPTFRYWPAMCTSMRAAEQARRDFTEALDRDPNVVTAYVNRGYMLQRSAPASAGGCGLRVCPEAGTEGRRGAPWPGLCRPRSASGRRQPCDKRSWRN